jgi:hypothetical protein
MKEVFLKRRPLAAAAESSPSRRRASAALFAMLMSMSLDAAMASTVSM